MKRVQNCVQQVDPDDGRAYVLLRTPEGLEFDPRTEVSVRDLLVGDWKHLHRTYTSDDEPETDGIMSWYQDVGEDDDYAGVTVYDPDDGTVDVVSYEQADAMVESGDLQPCPALRQTASVVA